MSTDTLTITDHRTGKSYELPITDGSIKASDLRQIKLDPSDYGLLSYDPAFTNTASTRSAISYLDGDQGILLYRGYPIEQIAEKSTFLETAYLILNGELPTKAPTIAAYSYRHIMGWPYIYPDNDLSYAANFLNMMFKMAELKYKPDPVLERALDLLFILHADHEQNCSTNTMRAIG